MNKELKLMTGWLTENTKQDNDGRDNRNRMTWPIKFVCHGHQVRLKVTGAKTG